MNLDATYCCLLFKYILLYLTPFGLAVTNVTALILLHIFFKSFGYDWLEYRQPQLDSESDVSFGCVSDSSLQKYSIRHISCLLNPSLVVWQFQPIGFVLESRVR